MAGQIIDVPKLTVEMRDWLISGSAEVLRDEPTAAVIGTGERAVEARPKGRR